MCSIVIIGTLMTMTGCKILPKEQTAERTVAVAAVLTHWEPTIKRPIELPRVIYVERRVASPVQPATVQITNVTAGGSMFGQCPPASYACQVLPTQVQLVGRPAGQLRLMPQATFGRVPVRLPQPAPKPPARLPAGGGK